MNKVRLTDAFSQFSDHWRPKIVAELNGQQVKLVKMLGDFTWHSHIDEDEMFLVLSGSLRIDQISPDVVETLFVDPGELVVVPKGVRHRPCAAEEAKVLLFEPATTLNTGDVRNSFTVDNPIRIWWRRLNEKAESRASINPNLSIKELCRGY